MTQDVFPDYSPIPGNKAAHNTIYMLWGHTIVQFCVMIQGVLIARALGDNGYGQYSLAVAFAGIFSLMFTMGVDAIVVHDIAQTKETAARLIGAALWIRIGGFLLVMITTTVGAWLMGYQSEQRYFIFLAAVAAGISIAADLPRSFFRGIQQMHLDAGNRILEKISILALVGWGIWFCRDLSTVLYAMIAGAFVALLAGSLVARRIIGATNLGSPRNSLALMKRSAPLTAGLAITVVNMYIPTVILSLMRDVHEIGWYSAALNIVLATNFIPLAMSAAILPVLSVYALGERSQFNNIHRKFMSYLSVASLPITAGIIVFEQEIITLLFGSSYLVVAPALSILVLSIPLLFISHHLNNLLIAVGGQRFLLIGSLVYLIATLVINAILVPGLGFVGTAISFVLVSAIYLALMLYFTSRWVKHKMERNVLGAVIGTALMVTGVVASGVTVVWIRILIAVALFLAGFLSTSGMKIDEIKAIIRMVFMPRRK